MGASKNEHYHKFREIFYPGGTKDEEAFTTLSWLIAEGYTDNQLSTYYGVSRMSIGNWKRSHEEIMECFRANASTPDDKVERALFERATGYDLVETKVNVSEGRVILTDVIKHIPPDTTAATYWLNNRRPDKWKSVVHNRNEEVPQEPAFDYGKLSPEEMDVYEKLLLKITPPAALEPEE
jgi:hypothetical protein